MINLLPLKERQEIVLEQRKNLAITMCIIVFSFLVSLTLILLIINVSILIETQKQQEALKNSEKIYQDSDFMFFKNIVEKNNQNLTKINTFYQDNSSISDILKTISSIEKPSGLGLTDIVVDRQLGNKNNNYRNVLKITLLGLSDDRDILSQFKQNMEKNQKITNMNFPPDNWLKAKDIHFNLTFEFKP